MSMYKILLTQYHLPINERLDLKFDYDSQTHSRVAIGQAKLNDSNVMIEVCRRQRIGKQWLLLERWVRNHAGNWVRVHYYRDCTPVYMYFSENSIGIREGEAA